MALYFWPELWEKTEKKAPELWKKTEKKAPSCGGLYFWPELWEKTEKKAPSCGAPSMKERCRAYVFTIHMHRGVQHSDVSVVTREKTDGTRTLVVSNDRTCCCEFPLPRNADARRCNMDTIIHKNGVVKIIIPKC